MIICALLAVIAVLGVIAANEKTNSLPAGLSEKFGCDRITLDARSTDKYCGNYELYKKDKAAGLIE